MIFKVFINHGKPVTYTRTIYVKAPSLEELKKWINQHQEEESAPLYCKACMQDFDKKAKHYYYASEIDVIPLVDLILMTKKD